MQQPPWMPIAWAELGQAERIGSASNQRILDYFRQVGHASVNGDETAWCAAFAGACLERAGIASTGSLLARSYLMWGKAAPAELGTIAVLSRGSDPALGHVGFLVGTSDDHVILLGGNQSNAVTVEAFDRRRVLGFRMPAAEAARTSQNSQRAFEVALAHVLHLEGGWSDDPFDPGGPTNKGITIADLAREKQIEVTAETYAALKAELRHIPDRLLRDIYFRRYWQAARCPELPPALALMHFDTAVNQGVSGAARMLQGALGVTIDGEIGPITLGAARARSITAVLDAYAAARRRRYRALASFWRFGRGWLARVDATLARARSLAANPIASASQQEMTSMSDRDGNFPMRDEGKGQSAPAPEVKWWGQSMTIWGSLLTALSTVLPVLGPVLGIDLTADLIERLGRDLVQVAQALGGLIGTALTIFGRVRATAALERRPVSLKL